MGRNANYRIPDFKCEEFGSENVDHLFSAVAEKIKLIILERQPAHIFCENFFKIF